MARRRSNGARVVRTTEESSRVPSRWRISLQALPLDHSSQVNIDLGTIEVEFYGEHIAMAKRLMDDYGLRREHWVLNATVERRGNLPAEPRLISMIRAHWRSQDTG